MTQRNTWAAALAPIGVRAETGQIIDPECVVTVRDFAPILAPDGAPIGVVTHVEIIDGHIVAVGTLNTGRDLPDARPTFEVGLLNRRTFGDADSDENRAGTVTFTALEINAVRSNLDPAWPDDPEIRFTRDWCVHVIGPDDLIPMPDHATAVRAANRFNRWWRNYLARRSDDGVDLPPVPAVVRPWPYSADDPDDHAKALAELRADDPEGWLPA
jgi:hypothetical protein